MSFGSLPRFWASTKITGNDMSQNSASRLISAMLPDTGTIGTIPTTGNVSALMRVPVQGTLVGIVFYSVGALAANDTNFITFDVVDLGTDGTGTTVLSLVSPINTTKLTGGQALVANGREILLPIQNAPAIGGNILRVRATVTGTLGGAVAGCHVSLNFLPTI